MKAIDDNTYLDDLHPSRFLKASDLLDRWKVQHVDVTVSRFVYEDTIPNPKNIDPATHKPVIVEQPVLYFLTKDGEEYSRGYLLSAGVDIESLKSATGATTTGQVKGKRIRITVGEWRGKAVLRIDPTRVNADPPKPKELNLVERLRDEVLYVSNKTKVTPSQRKTVTEYLKTLSPEDYPNKLAYAIHQKPAELWSDGEILVVFRFLQYQNAEEQLKEVIA